MKSINECKSLDELCELLNEMGEFDDYDFILSQLPVFGNRDVNDTSEVWSWDDNYVLVAGDGWATEPRCPVCGEASFHCNHDDDN